MMLAEGLTEVYKVFMLPAELIPMRESLLFEYIPTLCFF